MSQLEIRIATKKDLPFLNRLYAEMDEQPLLSDAAIALIWHEIQQVPNYNVSSMKLKIKKHLKL